MLKQLSHPSVPTHQFIIPYSCPPIFPSTHHSSHSWISPSTIYPSIHWPIELLTHPPILLSIHQSIITPPPTLPSIHHPPIHLSFHLLIHPSTHLPIYLIVTENLPSIIHYSRNEIQLWARSYLALMKLTFWLWEADNKQINTYYTWDVSATKKTRAEEQYWE